MTHSPVQQIHKYVAVFTSKIYQTTSTVLETPNAIFIIDPNWLPLEIEQIRAHVDSIRRDRKLYLIFTHSDYDHIIGRGAFPDARVIASQAFAARKDKSHDVAQAIAWDSEHNIIRDYKIEYPNVDIVIDTDGKAMHFDGTVLTFYLSPGHTPEGLYVLFEPAGVWIAGDYLSDVEFPLVEDGIAKYRLTMAKTDRILHLHQVKWLIPGHGTVTSSVNEILKRREDAIEYLDDLAATIHSNSDFPIETYEKRYPNWESLKDWHAEQLQQLKEE